MKIKKIFMLLIIAIFLNISFVFAAEPQIIIDGDEEAKVSETKILTVKISSEIEIGIISGTIEKNDKISNITVQGQNNWNLTYNPETGIFNIYKPEGAKAEEIMSIEYTASTTGGIGKISIKNLELTTVGYESTNINDITKEITIKKEEEQQPVEAKLLGIKIVKDPTKTAYIEGESFDATGMEVEAQYSDGTSKNITNYTYTPNGSLTTTDDKITISYIEGEIIKTTEQPIVVTAKVEENNPEDPNEDQKQEDNKQEDNKEEVKEEKDDTVVQEKIPNAGIVQNMGIAISICLIVLIVCYKSYRQNKDI